MIRIAAGKQRQTQIVIVNRHEHAAIAHHAHGFLVLELLLMKQIRQLRVQQLGGSVYNDSEG